jgi:hypothetical protein
MGSVIDGRWQGAQQYAINLAVTGVRKMGCTRKDQEIQRLDTSGDSPAVGFPCFTQQVEWSRRTLCMDQRGEDGKEDQVKKRSSL